MPQAQSGICAEANLHGSYLLFQVLEGREVHLIEQLKKLPELEETFLDEFSESMVSSLFAIGNHFWPVFSPEATPLSMMDLNTKAIGAQLMPAQSYDLFVQIRSDRVDVNHLFGLRVMALLAPNVELVEQYTGFRFLDGRDINGFKLAEGPRGLKRRAIALVGEEDPQFMKGSYIHIQRYRHHLHLWNTLTIEEQEAIIGRTRLDNDLVQPIQPSSHVNRTEISDEQGIPLLLQQGMPVGSMTEQGLFSVTCSRHGGHFELLLNSRLGDGEVYDAWLDYTQVETGAAFFAPSLDFIQSL